MLTIEELASQAKDKEWDADKVMSRLSEWANGNSMHAFNALKAICRTMDIDLDKKKEETVNANQLPLSHKYGLGMSLQDKRRISGTISEAQVVEDDISKVVNRDVIINLKNIIKETYKHTFEHINQEIIKLYDNQLIDFKFEENYKNTIERIQNSEKNCNIKITHLFTLENIKNIKLMHSNNHPTNYILKYLTNQILKILNLPSNNFDEINNEILSVYPYSIYSYNYYKFNWLNPKDCNEDFYKELLLLVLNNC